MKIIKEVPIGAIDGVNTIFTLKNDVKSINDIFFDGAIYTDYRIKGNVITLTDAPILSLFIDYETIGNTIAENVNTDITLGDIVSEVYNLTGQTPNSTNFNRVRIVRMINSVSNKIWKGRVVNLLNPNQIFRNSILDFAYAGVSLKINRKGVLNRDLNIDDTQVTGEFSGLDLAGFSRIGGDLIQYDYNSRTEISGLEGQTIKHNIGKSVKQVYELGVNFGEILDIFKINFGRKIRITETCNYEIINYKGKYLIDFSGLNENDEIYISYRKKYINLLNDSDLCLFPDNYGIDIIANLVAGELMFQRNMPNGQALLSNGYNNLQAMFLEFEKNKKPITNSLRPNFRRGRI